MSDKIVVVSGKRKTAVAKAKISKGTGSVTYNKQAYTVLPLFHRLALREPIVIATSVLEEFPFTIEIRTMGGGKEGQIQAARLALAKALVKFTNSAELKKTFLKYDRSLLVADTRRKEAYKPGDSKARSKRQKSYR